MRRHHRRERLRENDVSWTCWRDSANRRSGRILIDGVDVRDYTFECLRRDIAFVPQDIVLFNGSIADNIRLGCPSASAADITRRRQSRSRR